MARKMEDRIKNYLIPKIPKWISSEDMTVMTLVWCAMMIAFGYLTEATGNIQWLWGCSLVIILQYITDSLDGALGKYRDAGLIKWGYYVDHFLDYLFLYSILIAYSFVMPKINYYLDTVDLTFFSIDIIVNYYYLMMYIFAILTAFMVHSFLAFTATGRFQIAHFGIGPTEMRLVFIFINTMIIFFGTTYVGWLLPYVLAACTFGLILVVYRTQAEIKKVDLANKKKTS